MGTDRRMSAQCPFFAQAGFDFDEDGNIYLPTTKKICLNAACTVYLKGATGDAAVEVCVDSGVVGVIDDAGFRAV